MRTFFLVFLVVGLIVIVRKILKKKSEEAASKVAPPPDLANLSITDAKQGDSVSISGLGDEYEDLDFTVDRINRYHDGGDTWYEVSGIYRGRRVYLELIDDDVLEIFAALNPTDLSLADVGLTEDDLERMDEEQSRSNRLEYDGQSYRYESSRELDYFKDSQGEGEGFYAWDFRGDDGEHWITIEKWQGEPFSGSVSKKIRSGDVSLYRS